MAQFQSGNKAIFVEASSTGIRIDVCVIEQSIFFDRYQAEMMARAILEKAGIEVELVDSQRVRKPRHRKVR